VRSEKRAGGSGFAHDPVAQLDRAAVSFIPRSIDSIAASFGKRSIGGPRPGLPKILPKSRAVDCGAANV
jgi:hypothetical protein